MRSGSSATCVWQDLDGDVAIEAACRGPGRLRPSRRRRVWQGCRRSPDGGRQSAWLVWRHCSHQCVISWHDRSVILRALVPAVLFAALLPALEAGTRVSPVAQETRILHIRVTVNDPDGRTRAVPRHALLISDNPATNAPRRVVTSLEGTVDVRLRPGNYTIESEEPLVFQRRSYEWRQTVDVPAGRDPSLNLTAANAVTVETSQTETLAAGESSPSELLMEWQGNVVNLWSPTARGAGFVLDRRGLILTNERVVSARPGRGAIQRDEESPWTGPCEGPRQERRRDSDRPVGGRVDPAGQTRVRAGRHVRSQGRAGRLRDRCVGPRLEDAALRPADARGGAGDCLRHSHRQRGRGRADPGRQR